MSTCKDRENFKVAVRVRPQIPREVSSGSTECVEVDVATKTVIISKPVLKRRPSRIGIDDFGELVRTDPSVVQNFTFDIVLGKSTTQEDVFQCCAYDIVTSVLRGYNGSIIASGQTSSGKTYTIEGGTEELQGIIPRATQLIFSQIESSTSSHDQYLVRTSYLQIYNEKISDLLDPQRENLKIREDGGGGVFVDFLSEHVVRHTDEVMQLIQEGARLRTTSTTRMNKESSRSHAVFTIIVEHAKYDDHGGSVVTIGKLRLVDLAGSERLDVDAESRLQEETKNINVSLHNFSKVVTALTTPSVKHIPYRDSKLTRILQDSLGGNCKTTLIATVTPASECYSESMNTLKFAKRAKNIKNVALINQDISEKALISSYQSEIKQLKQQLQESDVHSSTAIMQLQREREEEQRQKEEVKTRLEVQQRIADEAAAERERLTLRIKELEDKLLCGNAGRIIDSDEFKQAIFKEQQRLRKETTTQFELKLAELELERKRLINEKLEVQKQKEELAKFHKGTNSGNQGVTNHGGRGLFQEVRTPKQTTTADIPHLKSEDFGHTSPINTQNPESFAVLQEYNAALSHPRTGIPCQELASGIKIFNGSSAVHWFIQNMEGVSSLQKAQEVGQRLIELGVFTEIQGGTHFIVSNTAYYQFCWTSQTKTQKLDFSETRRAMMTKSLGSFPCSTGEKSGMHSRGCVSFSSLLSPSVASLNVDGDLLEHFGLTESHPMQIHIESLYGNRMKLKAMINQENINSTDIHGRTPLMYAVIGKKSKCCIMLVRCGAEVNLTDNSGLTALLIAARYEYEDILKVLLKSGAETHYRDTNGKTVFHLAAMSQNYKCLEYLCRYGSSAGMDTRDNTYKTPLLVAVQAQLPGHLKRLLMAKADLSISDHQGRTALHFAVSSNSLPCTQAIVETKPNEINLVDTTGLSALHLACMEGFTDTVHYLSSFPSCDVNLQDENGRSAVHYAVLGNHSDILRVLLLKGASVVVKDHCNKTPLQYSTEMGLHECSRMLQSA